MENLHHIHCLDDFQSIARARLPHQLYSYIANGADDEHSIDILRTEVDRGMALPGINRLDEIGRSLARPTPRSTS